MKKIYKQSSLGLTFLVLFWLCGASNLMAQTTFSATGLPVTIPDPGNVTKTITVSGLSGTVATDNEVQLNVRIDHAWASDIVIGITPPGGTEIVIVNRIGGSKDIDMNSVHTLSFRNNAAGVVTVPGVNGTIPGGIYLPTGSPNKPVGSFSSLVGATRNGDWIIRVRDDDSIIQGSLAEASISFFDICTPPTVTIDKSASSVCVGATLNLSANGGSSYSWASSGGSFESSTGSPVSWSSSSAGGFSFTVTATNSNNCSATATASVTINAKPSVSISPANSSICVGKTLNLSASPPPSSAGLEPAPPPAPSNSYAWASSGGSFVSSTGSPVSWSSGSSGGFVFTVTATNTNNCSAIATTSVSVNALPIAVAGKTSAGTICVGGSIALTSSGGSSYAWAGPAGSGFSSNSQNPSSFTATSTSFGGVYSLTVSATTSCTATATTSISVIALPISYTVTGGGSYCQGGTGVAIGLSNSETDVTYQLKNGASAVGSPVSGTGSSISFGLQKAAGTYTVVATRTDGGCTATMTGGVSVLIKTKASATFSTSSGKYYICPNQTLTLIGPNEEGVKYEWLLNNFPLIPAAKENTLTITQAGPYTIKAICYTTQSKQIYISTAVPVTYSATNVVTASKLTLTANPAGLQYDWAGPLSFSSSLRSPVINNPSSSMAGIYTVAMLTPSTGCTGTATTSVKISTSSRLASGEGEDIAMEVNTYPNPTSKLLTVEVTLKEPSALKLQLYNATGNTLMEWNLSEESTIHRKEIDMSVYKDGLYLIQAQSKDGKQTKRVVKME